MAPPDRRVARWPVAAAILPGLILAACTRRPTPPATIAPVPAPLPAPAPAPPTALNCLIADSSAPAPDTIYVIDPQPRASSSTNLGCAGGEALTGLAPGPDVIYAVPAPGADLRDILDRGLTSPAGRLPDVVVTRDPDALAYAARRGRYTSHPLPWDRTYVLTIPGADQAAAIPPDARDALARDAVTSEARGATGPFWWQDSTTCRVRMTPPPGAPHVIAYVAGDNIARQLAERIAALAGSGNAPAWLPAPLGGATAQPWHVAPVNADSLAASLARGRAAAAVYAYPVVPPASCAEVPPVPLAGTLLPLVDSRAHALVRTGSGAAFYVTGSGALLFTRLPGQ